MPTKATAKTTARKPATRKAPAKPQDRKPKATKASQPAGWDLLKPFAEVPVWDQKEIYKSLRVVMDEHDSGELDEFDFVANMAKALMEFAVDKDAYLAFVSGPDAMTNASPLVLAWTNQMGEFSASGK